MQHIPRIPHCAYAMALLVVLAGVAAMAATTPGGAQEDVVVDVLLTRTGDDAAPFAFEPQEITIEPGTIVRWTWDHSVFHTITSGVPGGDDRGGLFDFSSGSEGETYEYTFNDPGEFPYFCSPHQDHMLGIVHVAGGDRADDDDDTTSIPAPGVFVALMIVAGVLAAIRRR